MRFIDSHCHLQDKAFDDDREDVVQRALETLDAVVVIGDDIPTSEGALAVTRERVFATVGIHPYWSDTATPEAIDTLRTMAGHEYAVGIGEIGLDYFKHCTIAPDVQKAAFRAQLDLAVELQLPVVIHNREAHDDVAEILQEYANDLPGGVMHCFAGTPHDVARCLSWGFHISFAGNVTFPKAEELRVAAKEVPLDRLLVETDAPYLAPKPVRGKRCEPAFVEHTGTFLAEFLGVELDAFVEATHANTCALYGLESRIAAS